MDRYKKENSFAPILENPVILDFAGCSYLGQIHQILKEKLGFPEYYGGNWDALWDCMDGLFDARDELTIEIHGFLGLEKQLRDGCRPMLEIFDVVHEDTPNVTFEFIS